ncbi:family 16 glycosylhydrolase [Paraglaciecola sp.]|uniref:glycoside hydrolase family 16 protein n=1 Tax=Paraglaciecola sp. TaxID=1920173 RepID=UPI00273E5224|nr:family 16 glycosylhydrolase [Paraglaciecola sp.]MDP5030336.1 family 16 glycosylhydrolase [Paraglaciecola sp.]
MFYTLTAFSSLITLSSRHLVGFCVFLLVGMSYPANAGWQVQWMDDFTGIGVNWDKWTAQIQANYNNEIQCYTDDDSSENRNYEVSNGTLKIIARRQNTACVGLGGQQKSWTSGRLNSKDKAEFLYGRVEARIRFLNQEKGTWPAFWMLENRIAEDPKKNDNDFINWPNPGAGEIDVWEWFSNRPDSYITNFFNTSGCGAEVLYNYPGGGGDVSQWHNYAIERSATKIAFYIDDILVTQHDVTNCAQYKEPMFVLLNVAIGGSLGGNVDPSLNQATMEVDYVGYCTATESNDFAYCNESTITDLDDDADGVLNASDLCPETPIGASVDDIGCSSVQEVNVAPSVSLQLQQNNVSVTEVDDSGGPVSINAQVNDANEQDSFVLTWQTAAIVEPQISDVSLVFDPLNLSAGSYTVSVEVRDDGNPSLASNASITFDIIANQAPTARISRGTGTTYEGDTVALSASGSTDPEQDTLSYVWTQTAGPVVTLLNANSANVSFVVPQLSADREATFSVEVSDGQARNYATVTVLLKRAQVTEMPTQQSSGGSMGLSLLFVLLVYVALKSFVLDKMCKTNIAKRSPSRAHEVSK